MSEFRVASRYAKSLIDLAMERGELDAVCNDMALLTKICEENKAFSLMLCNPIINHEKKLSILLKVFTGKVTTLSLSFFQLIVRKNRESVLYGVGVEFQKQYNDLKNIETAVVITASAISDELVATFNKLLSKKINKSVKITTKVDSSIIGGYILRVGDRQMDESVHSMLNKLKVSFRDNPYESKL